MTENQRAEQAVSRALHSGRCDIDQVPATLGELAVAVPDALKDLLHPAKEANTQFVNQAKIWLREGDASAGVAQEAVVYAFVNLFSLLTSGTQEHDPLPDFAFPEPIEPASTQRSEMHLEEDMTDVSRTIEYSLHALGHRHKTNDDGEPIGVLDEESADAALETLRLSWSTHADDVETWLVPYLVFRLVDVLSSFDIFHAMYGGIPRYAEFKIAGYLLWLTGRGKYKPASEVARVAHKLHHLIQTKCRIAIAADDETHKLPSIQTSIEAALKLANRSLQAQREAVKKAGEPLAEATLRVFSTFMESYFRQLAETGQFHAAMWSLSMFADAREVFAQYQQHETTKFSVLLIGETGTGKESIARLFLGRLGQRHVALNCAGIGWQTMAKDLDGILTRQSEQQGAYDGARIATGALLFDEIDKSMLDTQGGLLRLMDKPEGEYRITGDPTAKRWEGTTVATATGLIYQRMRDGEFLPDLFWRFDERIIIRPLREMAREPDDFKDLLGIALRTAAFKYGMQAYLNFAEHQQNTLLAYRWPGNLRELLSLTNSIAAAAIAQEPRLCRTTKAATVPDEVFNHQFNRASEIAALAVGAGAIVV